jgi:hypothetical protein
MLGDIAQTRAGHRFRRRAQKLVSEAVDHYRAAYRDVRGCQTGRRWRLLLARERG